MRVTGFRKKARTRHAKPDAHIKQQNPTKTAQQIYAKIPGREIAEVVEMVYKYVGRRKKLDHIFVQWPGIGPNKTRVQMSPFIKIKKRKIQPWYILIARLIVKKGLKIYHFIVDPLPAIKTLPK